MFERITGPYKGYHIAVYACEMSGGREFLGYYKICRQRPDSYWEANCLVKGCSSQVTDDPLEAIAEAEAEALLEVGNLATVRSVAVFPQEGRGQHCP